MKEIIKKDSIIVLEHSEIMSEEELLNVKGGDTVVCRCNYKKACTGNSCLMRLSTFESQDKGLSIC